MAEISVQRFEWRQWPELVSTWERIHQQCPEASFFVSRDWVDCWLATFGEELHPDLLTFVSNGEIVGCCLLTSRRQWVRGIPLRRLYLNCAGENEPDSTYIEFNSLLSLPNFQEDVGKALAKFLRKQSWDELMLQGTVEQEAVRALVNSLGDNEVSETPAYHVSFSRLREQGSDYLSSLSPKTRHHIRRTRRAFEEVGGACTVRLAGNIDEALEMLQQLAELHQARWEARGKPGCFSSTKFTSFHQRLIRQCFDRTMLFRVEAGSETVGLLYCFLYNRWVYHYQSGFSYSVNKRRNPGLLTLYYAIDYCMQQQAIEGFDFMAGDSEYKRTLTNESGQRPLRWFVIRRRTVPSLLYVFLRGMKRKYGPASAAAAAGAHSTGDVDPADAAQRQNGVETT